MTPIASPIGFIGLGLLGQAMALRLLKQGLPLVVWNREPERCVPVAAAGAVVAVSPSEVAARCRTICLCVIDGHAVHDVVLGSEGLAQAPRVPRRIVDFRSEERRVGKECRSRWS